MGLNHPNTHAIFEYTKIYHPSPICVREIGEYARNKLKTKEKPTKKVDTLSGLCGGAMSLKSQYISKSTSRSYTKCTYQI